MLPNLHCCPDGDRQDDDFSRGMIDVAFSNVVITLRVMTFQIE